jgi:hypothetical protein
MNDIREMEVAFSGGRHLIKIGDRFHDSDRNGGEWEIVCFAGYGMYSPFGIGGTPTIECKPLSEMSEWWKQWAKPNGNVDWCGDSVAACLSHRR